MKDEGEIAGRPLDEAAEVVVERGDAEDAATARRALEQIAKDGVVSWEAARDAFAHLSKVVSTPETRLELAERELDAARESAAVVEEQPLVATRLAEFEARLETVTERVSALGPELRRLLGRRGEDRALYEVAAGIQTLTAEANDCQRAADELQVELEEFQRWLDEPTVRYAVLEEDAEAIAGSLDDLATITDRVTGGSEGADPADEWFAATRQSLVLGLVLEDLNWELDELRRWAGDTDEAQDVTASIEDLEGRLVALQDRLETVAEPDWTAEYGEQVAAVESALEDFEPPVDWAAVEARIDGSPAQG